MVMIRDRRVRWYNNDGLLACMKFWIFLHTRDGKREINQRDDAREAQRKEDTMILRNVCKKKSCINRQTRPYLLLPSLSCRYIESRSWSYFIKVMNGKTKERKKEGKKSWILTLNRRTILYVQYCTRTALERRVWQIGGSTGIIIPYIHWRLFFYLLELE